MAWRSTAVHANLAPETEAISGRLRRLAGFVCLTPRAALRPTPATLTPAQHRELRRQAAARGCTGSHVPRKPLENNALLYPRAKTVRPVVTPLACLKTAFSPAEEALL